MRRIAALILACALAVSMVSCGQKGGEEPAWQEQYDLGLRYLAEGNCAYTAEPPLFAGRLRFSCVGG